MRNESSQTDPRALVKTATPGIFKRGNRYVVVVRSGGKQIKRFAPTMAAARTIKSELQADLARGEYRSESKQTVQAYFETWSRTYTGRTGRGVRPETLADYCRVLGRLKLAEVTPQHVKGLATRLTNSGKAPGTVRLVLAPLRAMLATALEEGLIRSNPCTGIRIAQRVQTEQEEHAKALSEEELRNLVAAVPEQHRLFVTFLASTGLRISEGVAVQWGDLDLSKRELRIRRRLYRGKLAPPKSRYGVRTVRVSPGMAQSLWNLRKTAKYVADDDPVFPTTVGTMQETSNAHRWFKAAARKAGVGWAGFHTLRHTSASMDFRHGKDVKQVQMKLGHHSPAFTLATYVHLLPDDLADADYLDEVLAVPVEEREAVALRVVAAS
jgi:integrase